MPLKLQLGISKKQGLPAYGSIGAACQLELEVDSSLLGADPQPLAAYVQRIYAICAQAVEDELARHRLGRQDQNGRADSSSASGSPPTILLRPALSSVPSREPPVKRITARQLDYACDLAERVVGLAAGELDEFVSERFGKPTAELTSIEGSQLIDMLRAMHARVRADGAGDEAADVQEDGLSSA